MPFSLSICCPKYSTFSLMNEHLDLLARMPYSWSVLRFFLQILQILLHSAPCHEDIDNVEIVLSISCSTVFILVEIILEQRLLQRVTLWASTTLCVRLSWQTFESFLQTHLLIGTCKVNFRESLPTCQLCKKFLRFGQGGTGWYLAQG